MKVRAAGVRVGVLVSVAVREGVMVGTLVDVGISIVVLVAVGTLVSEGGDKAVSVAVDAGRSV